MESQGARNDFSDIHNDQGQMWMGNSFKTENGNINFNSAGESCLRALRVTDPRTDKERILANKDKLLKLTYDWILEDAGFKDWYGKESGLLWIKGDPGKGKTMLIFALIDELSKKHTGPLSYFICQATDVRLNSAVSVLRGILFLLAVKHESIHMELNSEYEVAGSKLFNGPNAFYELRRIMLSILANQKIGTIYLLIDALDECTEDQAQLLEIVSSEIPNVKWIVSSRNQPNIATHLRHTNSRLDLELNHIHVSRSVDAFIDFKAQELAETNGFGNQLRLDIARHFRQKAEGTFLWVSLTCKELEQAEDWEVLQKLDTFPSGLQALYDRMMFQIENSKHKDLCKQVIIASVLALRPLTIAEMSIVANLPKVICEDTRRLERIVNLCGSFLTLRHSVIYFVHQSVKDYFTHGDGPVSLSLNEECEHENITNRLISTLESGLKMDICNLKEPGILLTEIKDRGDTIDRTPLLHIQYASCYWLAHLARMDKAKLANLYLTNNGVVHTFLQKFLLCWLEALSLLGEISTGSFMIIQLRGLVDLCKYIDHLDLLDDICQYIRSNSFILETAPLQIYTSVIFCPTQSKIRDLFLSSTPSWVKMACQVEDAWSTSNLDLEGHLSEVNDIAYSPDGKLLATASKDWTVRLWDISTGLTIHTIAHSEPINSVAFSFNSQRLVTVSGSIIRLWDISSYALLTTMAHSDTFSSAEFSADDLLIVSTTNDYRVIIWDAKTGQLVRSIQDVYAAKLSPDSKQLTSLSWPSNVVMIWDVETGCLIRKMGSPQPFSTFRATAYSPDGNMAALASGISASLWIFDLLTGLKTRLGGQAGFVNSVRFSTDGKLLAAASDDQTIRVWDMTKHMLIRAFTGHTGHINALAFSPDGLQLASASQDRVVRLWETKSPLTSAKAKVSGSLPRLIVSSDGSKLLSATDHSTQVVWNLMTGSSIELGGIYTKNSIVALSGNGMLLGSAVRCSLYVWSTSSGSRIWNWYDFDYKDIKALCFSPDGSQLATSNKTGRISLHVTTANQAHHVVDRSETINMAPIRYIHQMPMPNREDIYTAHGDRVASRLLEREISRRSVVLLAFSSDGQFIALADALGWVQVMDLKTKAIIMEFKHKAKALAFSPNGIHLASTGDKDIRLQELKHKTCVALKPIAKTSDHLCFIDDGRYLETDDATFEILPNNVLEKRIDFAVEQSWVTFKGSRLLYLPVNRRPGKITKRGDVLLIVSGSGLLSCFKFDLTKIPAKNEYVSRVM